MACCRCISLLPLLTGANVSKLSQLQDWLAPVKKLSSFGVEEVATMATLLKTYAEDVSKMSPSLITVLRLLHNLAIPPQYLSSLADGGFVCLITVLWLLPNWAIPPPPPTPTHTHTHTVSVFTG